MKGLVMIIGGAFAFVVTDAARARFRWALIAALLLFALAGCAALPMPMQPQNEQYNSNEAEGAWLVLDAVDTLQTMHLKKGTSCDHEGDPIAARIYGSANPPPGRVLGINLLLALGHTMVTSWLDDEVAKHDQAQDGTQGAWYVGRIVWHAVSITYSAIGVAKGRAQGCAL